MEFAIFLGDRDTVIYKKNQGIVLNEASLIAYTFAGKNKKEITPVACGNLAKKMQDRVGTTAVVSPIMEGGKVVDLVLAKHFLREMLKKVSGLFRQSCLFCIPCGLTAEELGGYKHIAFSAGIADASFVPSVIASAYNLGLNPDDATAALSILISESCTDIAVITNGSIIAGGTINEGGAVVAYEIQEWILKKYRTLISGQDAVAARNNLATLLINDESIFNISGVDEENGNIREIKFIATDCYKVISPIFFRIVKAVLQVINSCSPDVINDIRKRNVLLGTGAGTIPGLREFFTNNLDIAVTVNADSINSAINGAGKLLSDKTLLNKIIKVN